MSAECCADCGFLAARVTATRELVEIESGLLKRWEIPTNPTFGKKWYEEMPLCFVGAAQLQDEIGSYTADKVLEVVGQPRDCSRFVTRQHGSTPKEHQEMENTRLLRESLEKREADDKAWRAEQDAKRKEHEAQQKADDRKWQESQEAGRRAFQKKLSAAIAFGGLVVAVASALVGAYIRGK